MPSIPVICSECQPFIITCLLAIPRVVAIIRCVAFVGIASLSILIHPLVASNNNPTSTGVHSVLPFSLTARSIRELRRNSFYFFAGSSARKLGLSQDVFAWKYTV
jgi:hypothetical protein